MRWSWTGIQSQTETVAKLDLDIEQTRQTLARMKVDAWRIVPPRIEGEQAVALPAGTPDKPRWIWRERPAAKQSRERGSCMTELEGHLTAALKRLSAQCVTERRRQSEQVEALRRQVERQTGENDTLRRRIERLDEQVTRLTEYYGTSAAVRPRGRGW